MPIALAIVHPKITAYECMHEIGRHRSAGNEFAETRRE